MDRKAQAKKLTEERRKMLKDGGWKSTVVHVQPADLDKLRAFLDTIAQPTKKVGGPGRGGH